MDAKDIMKMVESAGLTEQISKMTGLPASETENVIESVLPMLLKGMKSQAENKDTKESFAKAVKDHGETDTTDLKKFLGSVDVEDGSKIVKHLLGSDEEEVAAKATKKSGIDTKTVMKVMAILAPLLMSKMGNTAKKSAKASSKDSDDMMSIIGGLMDGVDASDITKIIGKFF